MRDPGNEVGVGVVFHFSFLNSINKVMLQSLDSTSLRF